MPTARETAVRGLCQVFGSGGYSNIVFDRLMMGAGLSPEDRRFCAALFYGVAERAVTLDHVIASYCRLPASKVSNEVRQILRSGIYQLLYMPSVPQFAAVDETVSLAARFGQTSAAGLVNGILRSFIRDGLAIPPCRDSEHAMSVEYSLPEELIDLWRRSYPQELPAILEGTRGPAPLFVRVNTTRISPSLLAQRLSAQGISASEVEGVPGALRLSGCDAAALPEFAEGLFHVQDISSQLCAALLDAQPGMTVADFCSAPGGKSFTVAERMENSGELLACDLHEKRLRLVREGAARLGLSIIRTQQNDAAQYSAGLPQFDRILCDAVCSGLGVIRRKPEIRYKSLSDIDGLPEIQYNILNTSAKYLKKGGRLVYSTCTLNPAENEAVVAQFLEANGDFSADSMRTYIRSAELDCDGFFTAALIRE